MRQLSDPAGAVTLARGYEPFGKVLSSGGAALTPYSFAGEWSDPTGLIYLRARYYDPVTGRFISQDPVRGLIRLPQTQNPYVYSGNNPVLYVDPSGQFAIPLVFVAIAPWVFAGAAALGVFAYFAIPGVRENVTYGLTQVCEASSNGLNALFAKGEYVPPGLGEGTAERAAYREALHRYKQAYGLGATDRVEKWILDKMAELAKKGVKPNDIVDQLPQPPEEDYEDEWGGDE